MECAFDYVERFALLLNDLDGSMKLPPGKYHPENCLRIFSPMKIPTMNIAPQENPLTENTPVIIASLFSSKVMKIKASGIVVLQKSSRVHQAYIP